jgi:CheY-like chemotaxis protein
MNLEMVATTGPTVLVVDDRPEVAATIAGMCRDLGFDGVASDGREDIRTLLDRHAPAALIVDVMMPDQDGYEVLKVIARVNPDLPVLLVTGYGDTWLRMGVTLAEGHGLRTMSTAAKPVRRETLLDFLSVLPNASR